MRLRPLASTVLLQSRTKAQIDKALYATSYDAFGQSSQTRETSMTMAILKPALGNAVTAFLAKKHHMLIDGK